MIANLTCVESKDCTKAVLDGKADFAFVPADDMAKNGKFRGSCLSQKKTYFDLCATQVTTVLVVLSGQEIHAYTLRNTHLNTHILCGICEQVVFALLVSQIKLCKYNM